MRGNKKKQCTGVRETIQREQTLPDGTRYEECKIQLDKPIRKAIWGTTTIIGKQKN